LPSGAKTHPAARFPNKLKGKTNMNKLVSLALLIGGIVLIIMGFNATHSFTSDVSRFFTGSPTDKAVWMLIGGIVAALVGLTMLWRGPRHA
jgi:hypothetical protein